MCAIFFLICKTPLATKYYDSFSTEGNLMVCGFYQVSNKRVEVHVVYLSTHFELWEFQNFYIALKIFNEDLLFFALCVRSTSFR